MGLIIVSTVRAPQLSDVQKAAIRNAWNDENGQGNRCARSMTCFCVVIHGCPEDDALIISHVFNRQFAMPTACWYDRGTLSIYCGDAGSGASALHGMMSSLVQGYFMGRDAILSNPERCRCSGNYL